MDRQSSVVDPKPKESEGFGRIRVRIRKRNWIRIRSRYCYKIKINPKKKESEQNYLHFVYINTFFLFSVLEYIWTRWETLFRKLSCQNILRIWIRNGKKNSGSESKSEKMNSDPQHCAKVLTNSIPVLPTNSAYSAVINRTGI
jgi:hypothetical protein